MFLRELQAAQLSWVRHNFPKQLGIITSEDVYQAIIESNGGDTPYERAADYQLVANAINDGRLVKKKYHGLLGMAEELGELTHAFLKAEQGIRGGVDGQWKDAAGDACADLLIFMCSFCNTHGIDLQAEVEKAWAKVSQRDWQRWPDTGRPPADQAAPMVQCKGCRTFVAVGTDECPSCGANVVRAAHS